MNHDNMFDKLNNALILRILINLAADDFFNCISTCKLLYKHSDNDNLISKLCHNTLMNILPDSMKCMLKTIKIPPCDLFQPDQIMPPQLFCTLNMKSTGLDYSKKWFLRCMVINVDKIKYLENMENALICGYYVSNYSCFIGELKIEYLRGLSITNNIKGLYIGSNVIKIGIFDYSFFFTGFILENNYVGQINNNRKCGKGVRAYNSGTLYTGEWNNNMKQGYGKLTRNNGDIYEGQWANDKANGYGKMMSKENIYEGQWQDNQKHGKGKFTRKNGSVSKGEWVDGKKNGYSIYKTATGIEYEGHYKDDKCHGLGAIRHANGSTWYGQWIKGLPASNDALHENIRNLIDKNICTKILTNKPGQYCQFLYKRIDDPDTKFICHTCMNICLIDTHNMETYWTSSDNICNCLCTVRNN